MQQVLILYCMFLPIKFTYRIDRLPDLMPTGIVPSQCALHAMSFASPLQKGKGHGSLEALALMVVKMNIKPTLAAGDPQVVFEGSHYVPALIDTFDVSSVGKRFLMIKEPDQAASVTQIDVVLNRIEELKHTVPIH